MKKFLVLLVVFIASFVTAQTTVTFQVTDTDSQAWNLGSFTVTSAANAAAQTAATVTSTLNATGGASFSIAAGTYSFKACPLASSVSAGIAGSTNPSCYVSSVAVSGGTQTVTLAPPGIRIPAVLGVAITAYSDLELTGPFTSARYYNLVSGVSRQYNGTSWLDEGAPTVVLFAAIGTCNAGVEGTTRTISDGSVITWGTTVAGGGSGHVRAYCDGTNWTVAAK